MRVKYRAISEHIKGHNALLYEFKDDIKHCENNNIPISITNRRVERYDGEPFQSGSLFWNHDSKQWPIGDTWIEDNLPEDLFHV